MERFFEWMLRLAAAVIVAVFLSILGALFVYSLPFLSKRGLELITSMDWMPYMQRYGGLQFILGSFWVTLWSLIFAMPIAISLAVLSAELVPKRWKKVVTILVDTLAAVPSVVYGFFGLTVLGPLLAEHVYPYLVGLPLFGETIPSTQCYLTASIILALMITPYASAIIRSAYEMVPREMKEAVYALGGNEEHVVKISLGYIKSAVISGLLIAAGRALGETMAVTMLVGNNPSPFIPCLLCRGATVTSVVANEFNEAIADPTYARALTSLVLVLLIIGMFILYLGKRVGGEEWELL